MRELAAQFPKPSWYAGLEDGIILKDKDRVSLHIALAFPDTYEVGMSYLGQKILYNIVNSNPDWWAERTMCPEWEVARILKNSDTPLATLESDTSLGDLDAICFSVTHELCFTDILHMLDLAGLPLRSSQRGDDLSHMPLIMAGGGAMMGAEALSPFMDLAALGDGEELFPEILELLQKAKRENWTKQNFLEKASFIPGVYIPSFFREDSGGKLVPVRENYRPARRVVSNLDNIPYPVKQVTPLSAVHNRLSLEIARGCTRGCRFCHAGIIYRPPRERSPEKLRTLLDQCLDATGYDEVSFLSLSAGDYSALNTLYNQSYDRCAKEQITLALPSLRVSSVGENILEKMASLRRTGITLAPEAGTQRLRDVINKGITEEELVNHVKLLAGLGWDHIKLYFMIGLPTETDEDLEAIFNLCKKVRYAGNSAGKKLRVTASISTFTPKAFTPFQWESQISLPEMQRRISFLRDLFRTAKGLQLRWHEPKISHLEGILSRSDRRMADVVEKAYKKGAVYCSWHEFFNLDYWLEALDECGLKADEYIAARDPSSPLPWDHLESGVTKDFLLRERQRAYGGIATPDCRYGLCGNCGVCDKPHKASPLPKSSPEISIKCELVFPERDQKETQIILNDNQVKRPVKDFQNLPRFHYRMWHRKMGGFSLLSQLELQSIIEKIMRRARLPLVFSQGFHPLPKISFGRALPVGMESRAEWIAFTLYRDLDPEEIREKLNSHLREEIKIWEINYSDRDFRTAQAINEIFSVNFSKSVFSGAYQAFAGFSEKSEVFYIHKTKKGEKSINIRPMLKSWEMANENKIRLVSDWQTCYLSPLSLIRQILEPAGNVPFKLIKEGQIFPDGKIYGNKTGRE